MMKHASFVTKQRFRWCFEVVLIIRDGLPSCTRIRWTDIEVPQGDAVEVTESTVLRRGQLADSRYAPLPRVPMCRGRVVHAALHLALLHRTRGTFVLSLQDISIRAGRVQIMTKRAHVSADVL